MLWNLRIERKSAEVSSCGELGGITALLVPGSRETGSEELYSETVPAREDVTLTYVPYYAWGNRGKGEMAVWTAVGQGG